ncbi:hypothetical protein LCGC14_2941930, partial [marine sediment metagenome]
ATGFAIADNRTAEQATWDLPAVLDQLTKLKTINYEVPGIDPAFFDEIQAVVKGAGFAPEGGNNAADPGVTTPPVDPVSERGRVYVLGPHRVMCGDSTKREDVADLMGTDRAQLVCTDPPYGVDYAAKNRMLNASDGGSRIEVDIENDALGEIDTQKLWRESLGLACEFALDGAVLYAFAPTGPSISQSTIAGTVESGFLAKHTLIWNKNSFVVGRCDYHYKHEGIIYGWKPGAGHYFVDDRTQDTVLNFDRPKRNPDHPTMKPVPLIQKLVENSSRLGWIVYDAFTGSGSCLVACARAGRVFRGMELEPRYVDVIRRRWGSWAKTAGVDPGADAL